MRSYTFRLLNVFAEEALAGNPLCVFEDARGMSDALMQALAVQFNLSETTFVLPSERATARVRIFSTAGEFPFAGHPTLGTAAVVRDLLGTGDQLTLEMLAGVIPVSVSGDRFTLRANAPTWKVPSSDRAEVAALVGLPAAAIGEPVLWMNTGFEQLLVPVASAQSLRDVRIDPQRASHYVNEQGLTKIYLWSEAAPGVVHSRFFYTRSPGVIGEDPGTGSACANLGGWLIASGRRGPLQLTVNQGDHLGRPCRLYLSIDGQQGIYVGGRVQQIGTGSLDLPDQE